MRMAAPAEEEVVKINVAPELVLLGKPVVEIIQGQIWKPCSDTAGPTDVCDKGIDGALSYDLDQAEADGGVRSPISNSLIMVCKDDPTDPDRDPDARLNPGAKWDALKTGAQTDMARVCGFDTNTPGAFKVSYSFTDPKGLEGRLTRDVIVAPDCSLTLNPNNNLPEKQCESKVLNEETGIEEVVCSKKGWCEFDKVVEEDDLPDTPPVITMKLVPGVIDKTVNVRQYQSYDACKPGKVPTEEVFGDGLCDPGFDAYDNKQYYDLGAIKTTLRNLTSEVLACPPKECETRASCDDHKFTTKGLKGCLDTSVQGPISIAFTARDDSGQITTAYRSIQVVYPCPPSYAYCPGVGDRGCQPEDVCKNAEALAAIAGAAEVADTTPPSFERFIPNGPVFLVYDDDRISDGRTPFKVCGDAAAIAAARAQKSAGQTTPTEYPCALAITDDKDDAELYLTAAGSRAQQFRRQRDDKGSKTLHQLDLIGAGRAAPGQYHYEYVAWDSSDNEATHPLVINVGLRSANLSIPITIPSSTYNGANYVSNMKTEQAGFMTAALPTWQIFFGAQDIDVVNVQTSGANTIFQLNTTFYQLWNPADPTTFDNTRNWNTSDAWAPEPAAAAAAAASGRRRLMNDA